MDTSANDQTIDATRTALDRRRFLRGVVLLAGAAPLASASPAWAGQAKALGAGADRHGPGVLQDWFTTLYSGIMDELTMTPGRAARIYAACAVAGYEAVVPGAPGLRSMAGQLTGLGASPSTTSSSAVDWPTVVSSSIAAAAAELLRTGSQPLRDKIAAQAALHLDQRRSAGVPREILDRSVRQGQAVGHHVAAWAATDGAEATYTRPYVTPTGPDVPPHLWQNTPPNFGTAIDPYWGSVRPMALPSSDACAPPPPVAFSTADGSEFWAQAQAVLAASDALTDEGRAIALFWRDNPVTSGLPSGHWMRVIAQVSGERGLDLPGAAEALAMVGVTLCDAFISCWQEKYTTNLVRPVSYIRRNVPGRAGWSSFVNTPQFPEYTSGHSVASQAAADVATAVLGTFPFTDRTHELRNPGYGSRSYESFQAAATTAAGSRLLGGIHFPMGIDAGLAQGTRVADLVLDRVRTRAGARP